MILHLIALIFTLPAVESYCYSKTYLATPSTQTIWETNYANYDSCTFTIRPSSFYSSKYYLEIKWQSFDIKGDMPYCSNDYVEVFLKRDYKSIGKFCSNNLVGSKLFNMYSPDGYAKIKFHSDGTQTGKGFKLSFKLRNIKSDYLGYSFRDCSSEYLISSADIFYTSRWPEEYVQDGTCTYRLSKEGTKKLVFMDLDLRKNSKYYSCVSYEDDYFEIRGSRKYGASFSDSTGLKGPFCQTSSIVTYTTSYSYLTMQLKRYDDLKIYHDSSSKRGFVAGYVTYTAAGGSSSTNKFPVNAVIGIGVTLVVLTIAAIIACIVCRKKSRAPAQRQPIATSPGSAPVTYGIPAATGYPATTAYPSATAYPTVNTAYHAAPIQASYQAGPPYGYQKPFTEAGYPGAVPYPIEAPPPYSAAPDVSTVNQGDATTGIPTTAANIAAPPSYNPTYVQPYPTAADQP